MLKFDAKGLTEEQLDELLALKPFMVSQTKTTEVLVLAKSEAAATRWGHDNDGVFDDYGDADSYDVYGLGPDAVEKNYNSEFYIDSPQKKLADLDLTGKELHALLKGWADEKRLRAEAFRRQTTLPLDDDKTQP